MNVDAPVEAVEQFVPGGSGSSQCFEIAHIPQLEELEIGYCSSEEFNADVVRALSQRSTLTALDVTFCDGFDDECLALLTSLPNLRRLTVCYCDDVKRDGICHIVTRMPTLRHLDLSCNDYVNSDTFSVITFSDNDVLTEALAGMPSSVEVIRKATV